MHHKNADGTHGEKASWKLHKKAMWSFEYFLEATTDKTTTYLPSHHHLSNMNKTC